MPPVARLSRAGRFPAHLRAQLDSEFPVLLLERINGSVTLRNGRGPWSWNWGSWERRWVRCALAVTDYRLVVNAGRHTVVNVPFLDPGWSALRITVQGAGRLHVTVDDLRNFGRGRSGRWQLRLRTSHAQRIGDLLAARSPDQ